MLKIGRVWLLPHTFPGQLGTAGSSGRTGRPPRPRPRSAPVGRARSHSAAGARGRSGRAAGPAAPGGGRAARLRGSAPPRPSPATPGAGRGGVAAGASAPPPGGSSPDFCFLVGRGSDARLPARAGPRGASAGARRSRQTEPGPAAAPRPCAAGRSRARPAAGGPPGRSPRPFGSGTGRGGAPGVRCLTRQSLARGCYCPRRNLLQTNVTGWKKKSRVAKRPRPTPRSASLRPQRPGCSRTALPRRLLRAPKERARGARRPAAPSRTAPSRTAPPALPLPPRRIIYSAVETTPFPVLILTNSVKGGG